MLNKKIGESRLERVLFCGNERGQKKITWEGSIRKYSFNKFSLKSLKPPIKWNIPYYPKLNEKKYGKGANRWVFWTFIWNTLFKDSEKWYAEGEFFYEIPLATFYSAYNEDYEWDLFLYGFAGESGKYLLFEPDYMREWDYNMNDVLSMDFIFDENFVIDLLLILLLIYFFIDKYVAVLFIYFIYISYESIVRSTMMLEEGKYGGEIMDDECEMNYEFVPYTYTEYFMEKGIEEEYLDFYFWNTRTVKKYCLNFYNKFEKNPQSMEEPKSKCKG